MYYTFLIEGVLLTLPMALIIFAALKWVSKQENLQIELNPKTNELGPPHLCRGGWREGELRGCQDGYEATGIPVEPINTYSNLAYLAAGWIVFRSEGSASALIFFGAMTFLCFGSALYHAVKTRWSARWDHGGMYAMVAGMGFYVMAAGHVSETWIVLAGTVVTGITLAWLLDGNLLARMGLLMALIAAGVLTKGNPTLGWYSLGFFAVAISIWLVDKYKPVLGRYGHGLWHLSTAIASAIMFVAVKS
jgi:predicted membrane channel-forming protein YqfA (hemolysin III family)